MDFNSVSVIVPTLRLLKLVGRIYEGTFFVSELALASAAGTRLMLVLESRAVLFPAFEVFF